MYIHICPFDAALCDYHHCYLRFKQNKQQNNNRTINDLSAAHAARLCVSSEILKCSLLK